LPLLLAMGILFACGESQGPLSVIIIGVDTLRPDHLGCYGYDRATSPNIDELAAGGALFANTRSQSPWTTPSFATVLTSLYPTQHGAGSLHSRMRSEAVSLAEILVGLGYATAAIMNNPALSPQFGLNEGFEHYDICYDREGRRASDVTAAALEWLDGTETRPFFIFAHYFDPHLSYAPPPPYDTMFDPDYDGIIGTSFGHDEFPGMKAGNYEALKGLTAADWNHIKSLYDGEIAYMDAAVGQLLDGLEKRGLGDNTLIVLLGDHGEEFFEHEGFAHGHTLFDEVIKVPLIFSLPGSVPPRMRIARPVRLLDVMPTILDFLDIAPDIPFEGVSLRPLFAGAGDTRRPRTSLLGPDAAFSEAMLRGPEQKSITMHPWKLIYDTSSRRLALFNLDRDPGEQSDLIDHGLEEQDRLEDHLFRTLLEISGSWYVELVGDEEGSDFSLEISIPRQSGASYLELYKLLGPRGKVVSSRDEPPIESDRKSLRMEMVDLDGSITLAFKTGARPAAVMFEVRIDGAPALSRCFFGESLSSPDEMPFSLSPKDATVSADSRPSRPRPPYCIIWREKSRFTGANRIKLDEKTQKGLRAIGYIQ
jgi:arylsulfatase A-like enzyme